MHESALNCLLKKSTYQKIQKKTYNPTKVFLLSKWKVLLISNRKP